MIESRDQPIRELLDRVYRDEPPFTIIDTRRGERFEPGDLLIISLDKADAPKKA